MGVAVEGSESAWPGPNESARLPRFDALNRQRHYVEIFNRGQTPFVYSAATSAAWIRVSEKSGEVGADRRVWIEIDWEKAPAGLATGAITLAGAGGEVRVEVEALGPAGNVRTETRGFIEDAGVVAIEAEHFARKFDQGANRWIRVEDYGRTLSGMRAETPVDAPPAEPGKGSASLEYDLFLFSEGKAEVTAIVGPTMNFQPDRALRYAISFDEETPQIVTLVPRGYQAQNRNPDWEKVVGDNARYARSSHTLKKAGRHTLKFWLVDPGVVLEKLVVDLGGLRPSYLGPPESLRLDAADGQSTVGPRLNSSTPAAQAP
jgi:hypothetical protein